MGFSSSRAPGAMGLVVALAILLSPGHAPFPRRDAARDIAGLRQAECEYRGIITTFEELTRVYVLQSYEGGRLLRWESQPSPQNPETEALVTGVFAVERPKATSHPLSPAVDRLRRAAPPVMGVTWRYSTLAAVRIEPAEEYAADALAVYRQTVDDFIARMVVLLAPASLRQGPGAEYPAGDSVAAETVLLREGESSPSDAWIQVRIPSSAVRGWIEKKNLRELADVP